MIEAGAAYDYYRGASINIDWKLDIIKPRLDGGINPSNGLKLSGKIDVENNKFILLIANKWKLRQLNEKTIQ